MHRKVKVQTPPLKSTETAPSSHVSKKPLKTEPDESPGRENSRGEGQPLRRLQSGCPPSMPPK